MCESCDNYCSKKTKSKTSCSDDHCECSKSESKIAVTVITEKIVGPKGDDGCEGPCGPTGPCGPCYELKCIESTVDFCKPYAKYNTSIVYKVSGKFLLMVYGFAINDGSTCETRLALRTESRNSCDNGIGLGCRDSCGDSKHFIQIDLGDYIRIKSLNCCDPKMRVTGFRDKFYIHGSNKLGELGQQIYTNKCGTRNNDCFVIPSFNTHDVSDCGDLKHYGVIPFRYISVTCCGANIVLNMLSFSTVNY